MRLLVVEDDAKIASFITQGLQAEGFAVDHADNGEDGLHLALTEPYDAAVIDIMLPQRDGLSLIETMRQHGINTPVLILSAKRSVDDRVEGLRKGGDDYLVKPFAFSELLARLQALIRRSTGTVEPTRLTVGDLTLDLMTRQAVRQGQTIELRPREFALLEYLMRNPGRPVSKNHDSGTCVRLPFRSGHQCGGCFGFTGARQGGQGFFAQVNSDHPWSGICHPSGRIG